MTTNVAREMLRRLFEQGMNEHDFSVFDELVAPDYQNHNLPAPTPGVEGFKQVVSSFFEAFPDFRVELEDVIAEGDRVVSRGIMHGTQRGAFMGIPPTDRKVTISYIDIWRVENGKFVENWVQLDLLGMMQQLGVIPTPESAAT